MKHILKHFVTLLLLGMGVTIIFGCGLQEGNNDVKDRVKNQTPTPKISIAPTFTSSPDATQAVLPTPVILKATRLVPSSTPTMGQVEDQIPSCNLNGEPTFPEKDFWVNGKIVYQQEDRKGLYTLGGKPLKHAKLPVSEDMKYQIIGFSPDREWFAYTPWLTGGQSVPLEALPLKLLSNSGTLIEKTIDFQPILAQFDEPIQVTGWGGIEGGWISKDRMVLQISYKSIYSDIALHIPAILDPFTGEWHQEIVEMLQRGYFQHLVGFSNDLTRALFTGDKGIEMVDLENQNIKIIDTNKFLIQTGVVSGPFYAWSPDSSMVIYGPVLPSEQYHKLTLLSRDGKVLREFTFPQKTDAETSFWVENVKWSLDSRKVVITGETQTNNNPENKRMVYVYDVSENTYVYRCPLTIDNPVNKIFWSPDNQSFILGTDLPGSPSILYDTFKKQVIILPIKGIVGGWSDKLP